MNKAEIVTYLHQLNDKLQRIGVKGEVCLYGGAVMCLVYNARPSTKDVDAVFQPTQQMRWAIAEVGRENGLAEDWLNDAVKGFVVPHRQTVFANLPHLKVYVPEPDYLLAMKTLAARVDSMDKEDVLFLVKLLELDSPQKVFAILEHYYPRHQIRPATQFFIEELFDPWLPSAT